MLKATNISSVPQRSPFRYPGGKTWLIPQIRSWLNARGGHNVHLIEPFAGGGIVTLTAVAEGFIDAATMVELDANVAAVWRAILGGCGRALADQIKNFNFNKKNVVIILNAKPRNLREHAFQTILMNRVKRNGILASGAGLLKQGEAGYGLKSRWYPDTLANRILEIMKYRDIIIFKQGDGLRFLRDCINQRNSIFFIDPPYSQVGKRLYRLGDISQEELFETVSGLNGDFLMTCNKTKEVQKFVDKFRFQTKEIQMSGGLNKKKTEVLIGRDLTWIRPL